MATSPPPPGPTGIDVRRLRKTYRGASVPALVDLDLHIQAGEIFGLIGPNGAGKTTFIGLLLGLLRPDGGDIAIDGLAPDDLQVRACSGYLPERLDFDRWLTGRQFVAHQHALAGQPRGNRAQEVSRLLGRVGLSPGQWDAPLGKYSRGMLQRLGMAQALVGNPRYLFLDEPSSGVDPSGTILFREILAELKQDGVTVVLNSHQLAELEQVCDRVAYIEAGQVRAIEDLRADAGARVLCLQFLPGSAPPAAALTQAVAAAGGALLSAEGAQARVKVASDEQAADLLRQLFQAGAALVAAVPEGGRLERYFTSPGGRAS